MRYPPITSEENEPPHKSAFVKTGMEGVYHGHHGQHGQEGHHGLGVGGGLLGSQLKLGDRLVTMMTNYLL